MAITLICNKCKEELYHFGALLFSPPDAKWKTKKYHLCKKCYNEIIKTFEVTYENK